MIPYLFGDKLILPVFKDNPKTGRNNQTMK